MLVGGGGCAPVSPDAHGGQRRAPEPLEAGVTGGSGTQAQVSGRVAITLIH